MLRDANHRHTIDKFSFIESLSSSRAQNHNDRKDVTKQDTEGFKIQQSELAAQSDRDTSQRAGALATTDDTATIDTNWYQSEQDYSLSLAKILHATTDIEPQTNSQFSSPNHKWSKIFFALACSYCLFVIWWIFGHQSHNLWLNLTGGKNVVLSKSDVEFINYLERSLDKIDRDIAANKTTEEVVYVPVYTPSATPERADINNLPLSSQASSNNIPAPPAPLPIPAPPPLPAPVPVHEAIASKPKISHALIGVLELGEGRSAALVKVQGKTRRIWVGEEIHADGWILESVGNQRANIKNGEQVRSISVGETF